jgi:predicted amidohydrolase YtcJ
MQRPRLAAGVLLALCIVVSNGETQTIFRGGMIYTMDPENPVVEAVVVQGDTIVFTGGADAAGRFERSGARVVDLSGATMLPGLIDAHGHLRNLGRTLANLQLVGTASAEDVRTRVLEFQRKTPKGAWIRGRGWDQNDWEIQEFPSWRDLIGTEENPVYLRRVDGHAAWVNRTALDLCGIDRGTPDPPGGRILRDGDGEPTGVLIDDATQLVSDHIPEPTDAELDHWLTLAMARCNRYGLTAVHDAGTDASVLASLQRLHERGQLTLRVYCMLDGDDEGLLARHFATGPSRLAGGMVVVGAIKLYADGALGSRGAALKAPYTDDPGNNGLILDPPERLADLGGKALEAGFQVCTHAIGDRANNIVLNVYRDILREHPRSDPRLRIEHCQVVSPLDIPRFHRLGVIPSMQPTHATSDMYWAEERLGPDRILGAYAWRSFVDDGNRLPLGSDFPVESVRPLWGIYAAVTRQDHDGWPPGGWYPDQRLTVAEAVRGFTTDAAYAEFAETTRGKIAAGMVADFTVLDRDIFRIPPAEILQTEVEFVVVGGRTLSAPSPE